MRISHRFTADNTPCAYLPGRIVRMDQVLAHSLSALEYEELMNAGWRKFGMLLFRPNCRACTACRPIRIVASDFKPDRSQARAMRRNVDLTITVAPPVIDQSRLTLYQRYHDSQALRKGWDAVCIDPQDYAFRFLRNSVPALEISVWEEQILRAIAIAEVTPNTVSGIYHYHDPECLDRSLGTFTILQTIELARRLEKAYAYFGYYVEGCGSLEYKARFRPCEILSPDGEWRPFVQPEAS